MKTEAFSFSRANGLVIPAVVWLPESEPMAILQITHGMTEHMGRYESFAEVLTRAGIAVSAFDLRGHGKHPGDQQVAAFGEDGWEAVLQDMKLFFDLLRERFPKIPHYLHGFSLGSFLLREYLGKYPEGVSGAVILGTGNQPDWLLGLMQWVVKGQIKKVGFDGYSPLVRQLSFGTYNQHFKPNRTEKDWLCSDMHTLDQFIADPLCRENFSAGLFYQMLGAMRRTGGKHAYRNWDRKLPVLLICGDKDPVGNMGKGAYAVKHAMEKAGIPVEFHLLEGARHMVLGEECSGAADMARKWILDFLKRGESV